MTTTEIWADTRSHSRCTDAQCGAPITWAEIVKSGKRMPFEKDVVALRTRHDGQRLVEVVDLNDNHWKTCPGRTRFRR